MSKRFCALVLLIVAAVLMLLGWLWVRRIVTSVAL